MNSLTKQLPSLIHFVFMLNKREKWHFLTTHIGDDKYSVPIFEAAAKNRCVPLFKTLMNSHCMNNCKFCSFRAERKVTREKWEPEELAKVAMKVWKEGKISGIFLSSGVLRDPNQTVERELEAVDILRKAGFTSYIHLKVMPGTDRELMRQVVENSDRVGINIEFPRSEHYEDMKLFLDFRQDLIRRLKWLAHEVDKAQKNGKCKAGLDSQMVIGASDETDEQVLQVSYWLYNRLKARRVYYSSFHPVSKTPLENNLPESRWREYRLYQCSFLIQKYGYHWKDFILDERDKLPINQDPKFLIAKNNGIKIDINEARFEELVKIPGIGIQTAKKVLISRPIKDLVQLKRCGVLKRALPFLKLKKEIQTNLKFWN